MPALHALLAALCASTVAAAANYTLVTFTSAPVGAISNFGGLRFGYWNVTDPKDAGGLKGKTPRRFLTKTDFGAYIDPPSSAITLYLESFWMGCSNFIPGGGSPYFPLGCTVSLVAEAPDYKYAIRTTNLLYNATFPPTPNFMTKFTGPFQGSRFYFVVTGGNTGMNVFIDNLNYTLNLE